MYIRSDIAEAVIEAAEAKAADIGIAVTVVVLDGPAISRRFPAWTGRGSARSMSR